jgi:predicted transcriptional regulator YheO
MLNRSVEFALSNLIEAVKRSTGLELTDIDLVIHRADEEQSIKALNLPGTKIQEETFFIQNHRNKVEGVNVDLTLYPIEEVRTKARNHMSDIEITKYLEALQPEEEEEDGWKKCKRCDEDVHEDETHSDLKDMCEGCGEITHREWEQENAEQNTQYMNDRI